MEINHDSMGWFVEGAKRLQMENVIVKFSDEYSRKKCPAVEQNIDSIWNEKLKKSERLYNASKFRYHGVELIGELGMEISIGLTNYKETVCTNFTDSNQAIFDYGTKHFSNQHACFADPVGVTAVVVTKEKDIIVIKRSDWVSESKGKYDTPGGHSEPKEMLEKLQFEESQIFDAKGTDVSYEIFHSIVREVRDEINIPESCLTWPLLLGIMRNKTTSYKPCFIFEIRCSLAKDDIKSLYLKGGLETDESTEVLFISNKELMAYTENDFRKMKETWSPCGSCALMLYHKHLANY